MGKMSIPAQGARNYFQLDTNLHALLARRLPNGGKRWFPHLDEFGAWVGSEVEAEAEFTDRFSRPTLEAYDRDGNTVNRIRYNPAWQAVSRQVYERGIVGLNYGDDPAPFLVTFAMGYILSQADISLHCPVTMTGAVAYVLDRFAPKKIRECYLHDLVRRDGQALSGGTWATELHGGSDVGATTTSARLNGDHVRLNGLKWFTSNADGGLALATARPQGAEAGPRGLGLYLVPMRLPGGDANPMRIRRLKDKLGTCGIATAEVDLLDSWALEVSPPPHGLKMMMEALEFSRIHNVMAALGAQRRAFVEALAYASARQAFGATITNYPMVQDELLGILLSLEAGSALGFEAARMFDAALADESRRPWLRLVTALAKYQTAEDGNIACRAAMEIVGGNGYTNDYILPRLLRDAQVLTIWEGPANIQALELLRMLGNQIPGHEAFAERLRAVLAAVPAGLDDLRQSVAATFGECREAIEFIQADPVEAQRHARRLMALMADTLAAGLLLEEASIDYAAGDGRKAVPTRLYIEARLTPPARRGIVAGRDRVERLFAALVGYEPVSLADVAKS